jgi:hypothetical protein
MIVTNPHILFECADMTEENFQECLEIMDMKAFMDNPTQALIDAGVTLKKGITLQFVETEEAANALPANVFPLMRTQKESGELSEGDLDKVAGGHNIIVNGETVWCTQRRMGDRSTVLGGN